MALEAETSSWLINTNTKFTKLCNCINILVLCTFIYLILEIFPEHFVIRYL